MRAAFVATVWLILSGIAVAQTAALPATAPAGITSSSAVQPAAAVQPATETPALAPDQWIEKPELSLFERLTNGTFLAQLLVVFGALLALLRGLAEALTRLSERFPGTAPWAKRVSDATWILGAFLGKLGYSEPKAVTVEKVAQAAAAAGAPSGKPA
jgi:hypothetical protein